MRHDDIPILRPIQSRPRIHLALPDVQLEQDILSALHVLLEIRAVWEVGEDVGFVDEHVYAVDLSQTQSQRPSRRGMAQRWHLRLTSSSNPLSNPKIFCTVSESFGMYGSRV